MRVVIRFTVITGIQGGYFETARMIFRLSVIFVTHGGLQLTFAKANTGVFEKGETSQFDDNDHVLVEYEFKGINECATR